MKNCKWCNDVVKNSNADECDRCWELRWQCEVVPDLVAKILSATNNACTPTVGIQSQSEPLSAPKEGTGVEYLSAQPHSG